MSQQTYHIPKEGYRFGYWNISGKPTEKVAPITHIAYKLKPLCSRRYVTNGLTFVPTRITVPTMELRGSTCVGCLRRYLAKFGKDLSHYPKLRLGI